MCVRRSWEVIHTMVCFFIEHYSHWIGGDFKPSSRVSGTIYFDMKKYEPGRSRGGMKFRKAFFTPWYTRIHWFLMMDRNMCFSFLIFSSHNLLVARLKSFYLRFLSNCTECLHRQLFNSTYCLVLHSQSMWCAKQKGWVDLEASVW